MKYLFYLEPYTFIFIGNKRVLVYNTINSAYIEVDYQNHLLKKIIDTLNKPDNGYGIVLDEDEIADEMIKNFIQAVCESFSGDFVPFKQNMAKPFIFKPAPYMNFLVEDEDDADYSKTAGEFALQNLSEVTLFLSSDDINQNGDAYHLQMNHPYVCDKGCQLKVTDYAPILHQLKTAGVARVNVAGTHQLLEFDRVYKEIGIKLYYYTTLCDSCAEICKNNIPAEVIIHPDKFSVETACLINKHNREGLVWNFIIKSLEDIEKIEKLNLSDAIATKLTPFFNGNNLTFFDQYVFNDLTDIIAKPVSRKVIFRRQLLNENFFGRLWIDAAGQVYGNMNFAPVGNIRNGNLKDMVAKLMVEKQSPWLLTRDVEPCKHCMNRFLCPSISNYELAMNRYNLCHVI